MSRSIAYPRLTQAFSTSVTRYDSNDSLHNKLMSEIDLEMDERGNDEPTGSLKEYLENTDFKLEDIPGQEEVKLTRTFNDETITITFSIADINNPDLAQDLDSNDPALYDDEDGLPDEGQSGGANTKGSINRGQTSGGNYRVAPEDSIAPADRPELADDTEPGTGRDDDGSTSFPARMNISVERSGKGALSIEAIAQDGAISIENVFFFPKADLAHAKTAELDWQRRGMYLGPPFGNLDEDLQEKIDEYIEERGINTSLALFVPDYIDFKEQREYIRWLQNFKSFIE